MYKLFNKTSPTENEDYSFWLHWDINMAIIGSYREIKRCSTAVIKLQHLSEHFTCSTKAALVPIKDDMSFYVLGIQFQSFLGGNPNGSMQRDIHDFQATISAAAVMEPVLRFHKGQTFQMQAGHFVLASGITPDVMSWDSLPSY